MFFRVNASSSHKPSYGYYREKSSLNAQLEDSRRKKKSELASCTDCEQSLHEISSKYSTNMQSEQLKQRMNSTGDFSVPWTRPAALGAPHKGQRDISGQSLTDLLLSGTYWLSFPIERSSLTAP